MPLTSLTWLHATSTLPGARLVLARKFEGLGGSGRLAEVGVGVAVGAFTPTVTAVPATPTSATTPTPVPTPTSAAPIAFEDLRLGDTVAEYMAALTEEESRCLSGLAEYPQTADLLESALDMPLGEVEWFVPALVGCLSAKHYVAYSVAAHEWIAEQMSNEMRVCMEELGAIEALTKLVPRLEPSGNTWTFDADSEDLERGPRTHRIRARGLLALASRPQDTTHDEQHAYRDGDDGRPVDTHGTPVWHGQ